MWNFMKVEPIYIGGNIYCFLGQIDDERWFIASDINYSVSIIDTDPWAEDPEDIWSPTWWSPTWKWKEAHLIEELDEREAQEFFDDMLAWVRETDPYGGFDGIDADLKEVHLELDRLRNWG